MIGTVNAALEATLRLQINGSSGQTEVTAIVDTGYNGSLSLPLALVNALSLRPLAPRLVTFGNGVRAVCDFYEASVVWDGKRPSLAVLCVEGDPLIGTALLKGCKMDADFVSGGQVRIVAIP